MTHTALRRAAAVALAALAAIAAIIAADLTAPTSAQLHPSDHDGTAGRIVARRLADGRVEFGWHPTRGTFGFQDPAGWLRILPTQRYFPTDARVGRWLRSSPVEFRGETIGRINARRLSDGRIEFAFTPTGGQRIAPPQRYFPADARVGRWLRSTEITISPPTGFTAVSAGGTHTCGLRNDGVIRCWGDSSDGQSFPRAGYYRAVSAGHTHTCAHTNGAILCWGSNDDGKSRDKPGDFGRPEEFNFTAVSAGHTHTCGLRETGEIECWGSNEYGQTDSPDGSFTAISADLWHTCAIRAGTGTIECWGSNYWRVESDTPPGRFTAVSAGYHHACGLRESGAIECWGLNHYGETIPPTGRFTTVSTDGLHACGLRESGAIECWGNNLFGQTDAPAGSYSAVSAGSAHTCAIRSSDRAIVCWGDNMHGQAGTHN